ncbi:MAG: alpha/beta hydrolase [Flavobacteriales bacterium]|nr:MAG: alpha/beta hydrolase [Flavobacteriales bacterium]
MALSYGNIEYLDKGTGEVILVCHGIFGGFDQGYESVKDLSNDYRIISPSRFGYLNSDILGKGTPEEQGKAYVELLDKLNIDKVFILGTSAGGTVAIRFALDYPERCKGLILYSSAMPETKKPAKINLHQAPPDFLCNNLAMYLISPFFKSIMGMESTVVKTMLPIDERKAGVKIDGEITNPDMAVNYDYYDIEMIKVPTLIIQAKDDKLTKYDKFVDSVKRFKNSTLKIFDSGGHLLVGHDKEIRETVSNFINMHINTN